MSNKVVFTIEETSTGTVNFISNPSYTDIMYRHASGLPITGAEAYACQLMRMVVEEKRRMRDEEAEKTALWTPDKKGF